MIPILTGTRLDERRILKLLELSRACAVDAERIIDLVDEGILEPSGRGPGRWRFSGSCLQRARKAIHLQQDLGINLPGVALALDLMDEIDRLQRRLNRFEF
jgi:chaperone modulatory protein CbpM